MSCTFCVFSLMGLRYRYGRPNALTSNTVIGLPPSDCYATLRETRTSFEFEFASSAMCLAFPKIDFDASAGCRR